METIIKIPNSISICFIGGSLEKTLQQEKSLSQLFQKYDIEFVRRSDVYSGLYSSFSQIINELIESANNEFLIFISEKVNPQSEQIEKMIADLCSGFCFSSSIAFALFGATKELFRNVGLFDERFIGSEWEDIDFLCRLNLFGKAIKWEYNRGLYPSQPSRINQLRGSSLTLFRKKWLDKNDSLILDSDFSEVKKIRCNKNKFEIKDSWFDKKYSIFLDNENNAKDYFNKNIVVKKLNKKNINIDSTIIINLSDSIFVNFFCQEKTEISLQLLNSNDELITPGIIISSNYWYSNTLYDNIKDVVQLKIFHEGDKIYHNKNLKNKFEINLNIGLNITKYEL